MSDTKDIVYRYFSSVEGHVVRRYGAYNQYIGVKLVPSGEKEVKSLLGPSAEGSFDWKWDTDKVVRISEKEFVRYGREYNRAVESGALIEKKERDFNSYIKSTQEPVAEVTVKRTKAEDKEK